jgi:cytochrome c oxidase subunit IV
MSSATSTRSYLVVFAILSVLTIAEVGVVKVPGISRAMLISALVLMALAKAGLVLMTYMHLGHESRSLKLMVILPFVLPALYAFVLIAEASWRMLP